MLIACVAKGEKYGDDYVRALQEGVGRHLRIKHQFVCLSDRLIPGVPCIALRHELPGWWSKLELFELKQPLVYFDLDVIITKDLSPLLKWQGFGIIKDWCDWGADPNVTTVNDRIV